MISSWLRGFGLGRSAEGLDPIGLPEAGGLTPHWKSVRLDKVGSVSGLTHLQTHWDDALINQQYQRFLNGS